MTPELNLDDATRRKVAELVLTVSNGVIYGYEKNSCEHCQDGVIASGNTAAEILRALGYSYDEIRAINAALEGKSE